MIDFLQNDQGVTFTLSHQNKKFIGSSKYLIACDGASSFIRKTLGIKL
jgi:2-polyprenyl-6-methoxyphenol hydroxylase-like FAD-dependent oxidoreductase